MKLAFSSSYGEKKKKKPPSTTIPTIQQLVNQHKIILYSLLIEFPKVPLPEQHQAVQKFEHQSGIGIAFGHRNQIDILVLDMAEGGRTERQNGRAHLRVRDDLDAEDVGQTGAAVIAKGPEDEVLSLLVEDEDAGKHLGPPTQV